MLLCWSFESFSIPWISLYKKEKQAKSAVVRLFLCPRKLLPLRSVSVTARILSRVQSEQDSNLKYFFYCSISSSYVPIKTQSSWEELRIWWLISKSWVCFLSSESRKRGRLSKFSTFCWASFTETTSKSLYLSTSE